MDTSNPLSELKDIHLPRPTSIFPLTIGSYVIIILLLIIIIISLWWLLKRYRAKQQIAAIKELLAHLETKARFDPDTAIIGEVSVLLKRVAVLRFEKSNPQLLFGASWLQFLDKTGKTDQFTQGSGRCLGNIYQRQTIADKQQFFKLINNWLETVL